MDQNLDEVPTLERDEELWYEDGNIVLQAENCLFKVYRGVLASRSPVFQDMLSFPQPPDSDLVDGCPLVHLHDSPAEVKVFLRALYDPEFFPPFPSRTTFDTIIGCLRLGHKYGVENLRRRALVHLSSGCDTELSRHETASNVVDDAMALSAIMTWSWPEDRLYSIRLIQVAREVNALWLLPETFYNLAADFEEGITVILHGGVFNGSPTRLTLEDQMAFFKGYAIQSRSTTEFHNSFVCETTGCTSPSECAQARVKAIRTLHRRHMTRRNGPLAIWVPKDSLSIPNFCLDCSNAIKAQHAATRRNFWDALPSIYGLPPWQELIQMKVAAIGDSWMA
ncbi:hypothetical protein FB45DRAFT_803476 [Roridomyces roridus]|uniref:BTB domain-containing protein n=1 Tax=Roridomyces roridus TaxID=1738132 RepID=A0AAD7FDA1_9AGAR|nr:hypothetical protein FB45DRAFT_803476 [Roridomyces roridus]